MMNETHADDGAVLAPDIISADEPVDVMMTDAQESLETHDDGRPDVQLETAPLADAQVPENVDTSDEWSVYNLLQEEGQDAEVPNFVDAPKQVRLNNQDIGPHEPPAEQTEGVLEEHQGDTQVVSSESLVTTLVETVSRRRNKRRTPERSNGTSSGTSSDVSLVDSDFSRRTPFADASEQTDDEIDITHVWTVPSQDSSCAEDVLDPAWRAHWPDNHVRLVGNLLPRISDATTLESVMHLEKEVGMLEKWKHSHAHLTPPMSPTTNGPLFRSTWS